MGSYPNTPAGIPTMAAIDWNNPTPVAGISTESSYNISQSRVAVAQVMPSQLMSFLTQGITTAGGRTTVPRFEADRYCYRYAALTSPYDGTSLVNGFFRMHPIALQGTSSFAIDWTDGSTYQGVSTEFDVTTGNALTSTSPLVGTTKWYGMFDNTHGYTKGGTFDTTTANANVFSGNTLSTITMSLASNDKYTAIFSYDNTSQWPVALRFRYHVADTTGRLPAGRDFVQVIKLP